MNGFTGHYDTMEQDELFAKNVMTISQMPWTKRLRNITKEEIEGCAKADLLTKIITCTQTLWFIAQILSRRGQGLATTLLEIETTCYVLYALLAYLLWLKKPQDCFQSIVFDCSLYEVEALNLQRPTYYESGIFRVTRTDGHYASIIGLFNVLVIIGAVKAAAWNFAFPTLIEVCLWRSSVLVCVFVPILFSVPLIIDSIRGHVAERISHWCRLAVIVLYACVRLYLIVELFLSLRMVPSSVYGTVEWSTFIPHI